jgi:small subunit ribosomal protein S8
MNTNLIKLLLNLKNASLSKKEIIHVKYSKPSLNLIKLLYKEGFIQSFNVTKVDLNGLENQFKIAITLRYFHNKSIFKNLKIVSSPSRLHFLTFKDISNLSNAKKVLFLSTHKGFLTGLNCKIKQIGGVLLFTI